MWTDFNNDAGYTLSPGTKYQYKLYAYIDGVEYVTELASFTTGGVPAPSDAKLSVSSQSVSLGDSITLHLSAQNATRYQIGIWMGDQKLVDDPNATADYAFTPTVAGDYTATFTAYNDTGSVNSNQVAWTVLPRKELPTMLGDVNGDGAVNATDALKALQHSVDLVVLSPAEFTRSDVNRNETVDANDALLILQYSVGLISAFTDSTVVSSVSLFDLEPFTMDPQGGLIVDEDMVDNMSNVYEESF